MDIIQPYSEFEEYITLLGRPSNREANMPDDREVINDFSFLETNGTLTVHYGTFGEDSSAVRFVNMIDWESDYWEKVDVETFEYLVSQANEMFGEENCRIYQDKEKKPDGLMTSYRNVYGWHIHKYFLLLKYTEEGVLTINWQKKYYKRKYEMIAACMLASYAQNELSEDSDNFSIICAKGNVISDEYDPYELASSATEFAVAICLQYDSDNSDIETNELYGVIQNITLDHSDPNFDELGVKLIAVGDNAKQYYDDSAEDISLEDYGIEYGHRVSFSLDKKTSEDYKDDTE